MRERKNREKIQSPAPLPRAKYQKQRHQIGCVRGVRSHGNIAMRLKKIAKKHRVFFAIFRDFWTLFDDCLRTEPTTMELEKLGETSFHPVF